LVIPLAMVVIDEFLECASKVALAEAHHPIEALEPDRPHGRRSDMDRRCRRRARHL
jgi:hypothetical protein